MPHQGRIGSASSASTVSVPTGNAAQGGKLASRQTINTSGTSSSATGTRAQGAILRSSSSGDSLLLSADTSGASGTYCPSQYRVGSLQWWTQCNPDFKSSSSGGSAPVKPTPTPTPDPDPDPPDPLTRDQEVAAALIALGVPESRITWVTEDGVDYIKMINAVSRGLSGELDLSGLVKLSGVYCDNNSLTSLDVSGCTSLEYLSCDNNSLISLDVSGLTNLTTLNCNRNSLASLDVSGCTNLTSLECQNNNSLTSLDAQNVASNLVISGVAGKFGQKTALNKL